MMTNNKKSNIFITGITSFLGINLAKHLINNNYNVFAIIRSSSKKLNEIKNLLDDNHIIYLDINEDSVEDFETNIKKFLNDSNCINENNILIHLAWDSSSELGRYDEDLQKKNYEGSKKLANIINILNFKKFIFTSSQADKNNTPYGIYKKKFVEYAKENLENFVYLRIFSMYGEEDYHNSIITYVKNCIIERKDAFVGPCNYLWNYLHIDDFVKIMEYFINEDINYNLVYDVASDDTKLLKEYLMYFENKYNLNIHYNNSKKDIEPFDIPDITNLRKVIGNYKFKKFNYEIKEKKI